MYDIIHYSFFELNSVEFFNCYRIKPLKPFLNEKPVPFIKMKENEIPS